MKEIKGIAENGTTDVRAGKKESLNEKKSLNESSSLIYLNWNPCNLKTVFKNAAYCSHSALEGKSTDTRKFKLGTCSQQSLKIIFTLFALLSSLAAFPYIVQLRSEFPGYCIPNVM